MACGIDARGRGGRIGPGRRWLVVLAVGLLAATSVAAPPKRLVPPMVEGPFLRPAAGGDAEPRWGFKDGLSVGLWPTRGPRGLIRIYTPYLGQPPLTPINFIAIEPIVDGKRGLSELEPSHIDPGQPGKAMWTTNALDAVGPITPREPWRPARGVVGNEDGQATLSVFVHVEPFDHGARPIIEVMFRADRPHEVSLRTHSAEGGRPMRSCILSATMGNYARLRRLYLKDRVVNSRTLYDPFRPVFAGFAEHHQWGLDALRQQDGMAIVAAASDEVDPAGARYDPDVVRGWHYQGVPGTQFWQSRQVPGLVARVNARRSYWASRSRIPGGVAFENFELEARFQPGQEFRFGVIAGTPSELGFPEP